jgi:hypothetical protein
VQNEIARACRIFQAHAGNRNFPWQELFEPFNREFFQQYPRYVRVSDSYRYLVARLRTLMQGLLFYFRWI